MQLSAKEIIARDVELYSDRNDKCLNIYTGRPLTGQDKIDWQDIKDKKDMWNENFQLVRNVI